ncbi:ABC transporter ATP-binding protein/permease [Gammaproteobacteria bacterium]|nr:ABC transporter ATP-binding protein/permease [Gammaproteobacteria bacterium]
MTTDIEKNNDLLSSIKSLWLNFSRKRKTQLILITLATFITAILDLVSIGSIMPFISVIMDSEQTFNNPNFNQLFLSLGYSSGVEIILPLTIFFIGINVLTAIIKIVIFWFQNKISVLCGNDLSRIAYTKTIYQSFSTHIHRNSGDVISSIVNNVNITVFGVLYMALLFISSAIFSITILAGILIIDPVIAFIAFVTLCIFYIPISLFLKSKLEANSKIVDLGQKKIIRFIQEALGGIRNLILDKSHSFFIKKYNEIDFKLRDAVAENKFLGSVPRYVIEALIVILMALLGLYYASQPNGMNEGLPILGFLALASQKLIPNMQQIYRCYASIAGSKENLDDTLRILSQDYVTNDDDLASQKVIDNFNKISLKNISFSYSKDSPLIFDSINLEIYKGEKVGIVGITGGGKSTLIDLILGLLDPISGEINIDNNNINEVKSSWQKMISHVPQDVYYSDDSFSKNIAFGSDLDSINELKLIKASKDAQIYNYIMQQNDKFNHVLGESGVQLSGGQKQRLGIARALYKDSNLIIFDEATSALDEKTEKDVVNSIQGIDSQKTVLIIAHRLSTIEHADRIISVGNGNIKVFNSFADYKKEKSE